MAQKIVYDRETIGALRTKLAYDVLEILNETEKASKFGALKKEMLLKLAPTIMPRVTELMGEGGGAVKFEWQKLPSLPLDS